MPEEAGDEDTNHVQKASVATQQGLISMFSGIYHLVLGFSQWTKDRHIIVQAAIMIVVTPIVANIGNLVGQFFFTTFWGQAVYASGLRLRLLPFPISLTIYILIIVLILLAFSMDSSIRNLQSELDEIKEEIATLEDNSDTNE